MTLTVQTQVVTLSITVTVGRLKTTAAAVACSWAGFLENLRMPGPGLGAHHPQRKPLVRHGSSPGAQGWCTDTALTLERCGAGKLPLVHVQGHQAVRHGLVSGMPRRLRKRPPDLERDSCRPVTRSAPTGAPRCPPFHPGALPGRSAFGPAWSESAVRFRLGRPTTT